MDFLFAWMLVFFAGPQHDACKILDGIDTWRSVAWTTADPGRLAEVYPPDSKLAEVEEQRLAEYLDRGVAVTGMFVERADCQVLARSEREARLHVTERVGSMTVEFDDDTARSLPGSQWKRHIITIEFVEPRWRISQVELFQP